MRQRRDRVDPWGKRKHPARYTPKVLREMLVTDIVNNKPLGGPDEWGCAFLIGACAVIAKADRKPVDDVFQSILAEGASLTGRTTLPLG